MRNKIMVALLALGLLAVAAPAAQEGRGREMPRDLPELDETRQTYSLNPGARVEIRGINGQVDVNTHSGSSAEVHIVRSARNRDDLQYRRIIIEHTPDSLIVRGEKDNERGRRSDHREVRQRVTLSIPRQVDFTASGINGKTTVGEIDGPVKLNGINGRVSVEQAAGHVDVSGINGRVTVNITRLGEKGVTVSGVNGGVEMRFDQDVDADLNVSGVNGSVSTDMQYVTIQGKIERGNFRATIGRGGTPISVSGVNGRVRLARTSSPG